MSTTEIVRKVNGLVISKADSVTGGSSQNQTSEMSIFSMSEEEIVKDANAVVISKADSVAGSSIQKQTAETPILSMAVEEIVKDVNAVVVSKADSVAGSSLQHQTSEVPFPKRRRLSILGWGADGYPITNPNAPSEKETRARFIQDLADKKGITFEEMELKMIKGQRLCGKNWLPKFEWMHVDVNSGADVLARLHVRTVFPESKPEYDPALVDLHDPQTKLYAFYKYLFRCNSLSRVLKPLVVEPGHVSYLVSVHPYLANLLAQDPFCSDGHPLAVIAEKVSFTAISKARWELEKPILRGELDITFLAAPPSEVFKVNKEEVFKELFVEGTLVESGKDSLAVKVDIKTKKNGNVGYTARATFYTTADPKWV